MVARSKTGRADLGKLWAGQTLIHTILCHWNRVADGYAIKDHAGESPVAKWRPL